MLIWAIRRNAVGDFTKVFIGCENVRPIMTECDWAFGVLHEDNVEILATCVCCAGATIPILASRTKTGQSAETRFCGFLYQQMSYREAFFRALSRYKHVDAPGRSMNNMPGIDPVPDELEGEGQFLRAYKFVVAFENSSAPGYNTESSRDRGRCHADHWGDLEIGRSWHRPLPQRARLFAQAAACRRGCPVRRIPSGGAAPTFLQRSAAVSMVMRGIRAALWATAGFDALVERVVARSR